MPEQCKQPAADLAADVPYLQRAGRSKAVAVELWLLEELPLADLGAAVHVLAALDRAEDFGPAELADRLAWDEQRAADLMARLHDLGVIFWGAGPLPRNYLHPEPSPPRPLPPVVMRDPHQPAEWAGNWPSDPIPAERADVAYALMDVDERCAYVGSTDTLRRRLHQHAGNGRAFAHWRAYRCADRATAYAFEHHLNLTLQPYGNPDSDAQARAAYERVNA